MEYALFNTIRNKRNQVLGSTAVSWCKWQWGTCPSPHLKSKVKEKKELQTNPSKNHRIVELFKLEKTSKNIGSNHTETLEWLDRARPRLHPSPGPSPTSSRCSEMQGQHRAILSHSVFPGFRNNAGATHSIWASPAGPVAVTGGPVAQEFANLPSQTLSFLAFVTQRGDEFHSLISHHVEKCC